MYLKSSKSCSPNERPSINPHMPPSTTTSDNPRALTPQPEALGGIRCAVIVFPGTWSDGDCHHVLTNVFGAQTDYVWHTESDLSPYDLAILPGGFAYGDHLRPGAIARFSPIMEGIRRMAHAGKTVIGICNGFQILCEAQLLPGALLRNDHLQYRCQWTHLRVETTNSRFTSVAARGDLLQIPISHGDGNYFADPDTITQLEQDDRIIFRYATPDGEITQESNPNGSLGNIAGITNPSRNVLGMMPHPERCCEPELGAVDGRTIFASMLRHAGMPLNG